MTAHQRPRRGPRSLSRLDGEKCPVRRVRDGERIFSRPSTYRFSNSSNHDSCTADAEQRSLRRLRHHSGVVRRRYLSRQGAFQNGLRKALGLTGNVGADRDRGVSFSGVVRRFREPLVALPRIGPYWSLVNVEGQVRRGVAGSGCGCVRRSWQVRELIRAIDWSATPLGPVGSWSPVLRTMVRGAWRRVSRSSSIGVRSGWRCTTTRSR